MNWVDYLMAFQGLIGAFLGVCASYFVFVATQALLDRRKKHSMLISLRRELLRVIMDCRLMVTGKVFKRLDIDCLYRIKVKDYIHLHRDVWTYMSLVEVMNQRIENVLFAERENTGDAARKEHNCLCSLGSFKEVAEEALVAFEVQLKELKYIKEEDYSDKVHTRVSDRKKAHESSVATR